MQIFFGILTIILGTVGSLLYIRDIIAGTTKPHLYTWLIWAIVSAVVIVGQVTKGAGAGAWSTEAAEFFTVIILFFAYTHGTKDIRKIDTVFLILSLGAIIPWFLTNDPTLSVILATAINVVAYFPTIRKLYRKPKSETLSMYALNLLRHSLSLLALSSLSVATYLFPAACLIMNAVVVTIICVRRSR